MLVILRILFGFALFVVFGKALEAAAPGVTTDGLTDAGYLALAVLVGMANAIVWAPWVGRWMADPLTGAFTSGHPADFTNHVLQLGHKLALRRWRRTALFFAFLEGVRHPDLPGAFVLGMHQARPGSWLEKVFAREVWRFENAENCLRAWAVLSRHGIPPDLHRKAEVNLLLLSQRREAPPPPDKLAVPQAPPAPKPVRNPAIRIAARPAREPHPGAPPTEVAGGSSVRHGDAPDAVAPIAAAGGGLGEALSGLPEGTVSPAGPGPRSTPEPASPEGAASRQVWPQRKLGLRQRLRVLLTGTLDD